MSRRRLPVSGVEVELRQPAGSADVLLAEATAYDVDLALTLAGYIARPVAGPRVDWAALPHTDVDVLVLLARQTVFGDLVRATVRCPLPECGVSISVGFSTERYLDHHRPRPAAGVLSDDRAGWFRLATAPVRFRIPDAADIVAATTAPRPDQALLGRCAEPARISGPLRRRVERAMSRLAPSLVGDLAGQCPDCRAAVTMRFDPISFCLTELSHQAASVFEDVHLIASVYHWTEAQILALPRRRRTRYSELVREERGAA
jgi:hypothetical protein